MMKGLMLYLGQKLSQTFCYNISRVAPDTNRSHFWIPGYYQSLEKQTLFFQAWEKGPGQKDSDSLTLQCIAGIQMHAL